MGQIIRAERTLSHQELPIKFLTFQLNEEIYAIEVMQIKKVIEYGAITHVPMVPNYVRGILNLLGQVVPVVDLLICFGEPSTEISRRTCIIIVEVHRSDEAGLVDVGIVVDAVNNVVEFLPQEIVQPPTMGNKTRAKFIKGIGKIAEHFVILLDMRYILSLDELTVLDSIRTKQPESLLEKTEDDALQTAKRSYVKPLTDHTA